MERDLTVRDVVAGLRLEVLAGAAGLDRKVDNPSLTKPGLELAGLFDFYEHDRIQIVGSKEVAFFHWLSPADQEIRTRMLFEKRPPAFVFSKNVVVPDLFVRLGEAVGIPVLKSAYKTSSLFSELFNFLQERLAERTRIHGVLLDINGVGVVITGESGIGKSEVALELVRRGYMLVADDIVEAYQKEKGILIGTAPELLRKYLEIRGIGIVNVVNLFGVRAYREAKRISLFVNLVRWSPGTEFNRLGLHDDAKVVFETEVTSVSIPITEARNTATLVEAAAFDFKAKQLGYHSAQQFESELNAKIRANAGSGEE